MSFITS